MSNDINDNDKLGDKPAPIKSFLLVFLGTDSERQNLMQTSGRLSAPTTGQIIDHINTRRFEDRSQIVGSLCAQTTNRLNRVLTETVAQSSGKTHSPRAPQQAAKPAKGVKPSTSGANVGKATKAAGNQKSGNRLAEANKRLTVAKQNQAKYLKELQGADEKNVKELYDAMIDNVTANKERKDKKLPLVPFDQHPYLKRLRDQKKLAIYTNEVSKAKLNLGQIKDQIEKEKKNDGVNSTVEENYSSTGK